MSRWVEVSHTRDECEIPGEGVEYITAADEERRRINRERQRRFRERVKAGAKIAVYKPREPGKTKAYTRRTKVDRGCNCTLLPADRGGGEEEKILRAFGIRYMMDTETGETYTLPDPMSEQWKTTQRELLREETKRTPEGVVRRMQKIERTVKWLVECGRWNEEETANMLVSLACIEEALRRGECVSYSDPGEYNPMFEREDPLVELV